MLEFLLFFREGEVTDFLRLQNMYINYKKKCARNYGLVKEIRRNRIFIMFSVYYVFTCDYVHTNALATIWYHSVIRRYDSHKSIEMYKYL